MRRATKAGLRDGLYYRKTGTVCEGGHRPVVHIRSSRPGNSIAIVPGRREDGKKPGAGR